MLTINTFKHEEAFWDDDARWCPECQQYIAFTCPSCNGDGSVVEVQIKTLEMYQHSEYGIASHISYKGKRSGEENPESIAWIKELLPDQDTKTTIAHHIAGQDVPHWIKDLVQYHQEQGDHEAFKEDLKKDFFQHRIFVFSPKGDVVDLPTGSTPVDFAYAIHSDLGNHAHAVRINGKYKALDTPLHGGETVLIETSRSSKPSPKWLGIAHTADARKKIRAALHHRTITKS